MQQQDNAVRVISIVIDAIGDELKNDTCEQSTHRHSESGGITICDICLTTKVYHPFLCNTTQLYILCELVSDTEAYYHITTRLHLTERPLVANRPAC